MIFVFFLALVALLDIIKMEEAATHAILDAMTAHMSLTIAVLARQATISLELHALNAMQTARHAHRLQFALLVSLEDIYLVLAVFLAFRRA